MRFILTGSFLLLTLFTVQAQQRERILIDDDWRFAFGHAADASKDFNFSIAPIYSKSGKAETTAIARDFDDSSWRKLNLPHDWAVELPFVESDNFDVMAHGYKPVGGLFPETSIGWYRKSFSIQPSDSGRRFTIQFDGVFRDSRVWLNGFYLGNNESGYVGQTYDITDYVDFKKPNVLVVRVDATQYEGWFYEGAGIYRHVWLNKFANTHLGDGFFIRSEVTGKNAIVNVEIPVANSSYDNFQGSAIVKVKNRNGHVLVTSDPLTVNLNPSSTVTLAAALQLNEIILWSLENPYLYELEIDLSKGNQLIDRRTERFGVRTIQVDAVKGLTLNGKHIKVRGVNCHQDHAGVGSALPDYLQYYRIRLLKEMGVNAYRTSHNAPTPELLEACDSLGMLVMDETRLLNSSPEYLDQMERIVIRDRNHPSVYMWSIGNEEGYLQTNSTGKRIALTMLDRLKRIDPTRTATYAADLGNVWTGVNEVIPVRGFNYREKFVVPYHNDHPDQPVVGTEMGSTVTTRGIYAVDSVKGYVPDQDISAPWWASTAEAWWPIAADNDWFMGGFIWTGFDYRGEPTPFKWPNVNSHFGVMDMCGFPKNIYYYYKSWWSDEDVIHISPHWNWKGQEGKVIDVWVNSNAEEVELFLNKKSLGKKAMPRNSHLKWQVPYQPGVLVAVGKRGNKKFETRMETSGPAAKLLLSVDQSSLLPDGNDATVVNVSVVDSRGRIVPDASNEIHFRLDGPGKILGGGNGDPSSHEQDVASNPHSYQRKLFGGRAQIIVQSLPQNGVIQIKASSNELTNGIATIQVKPLQIQNKQTK